MDQMADEMTLRADLTDKGRVNTAEERGERIQSETQVSDWRLGASAETEAGKTSRDTDTQRPTECDGSSSPLFSLKMYLRRSSSASSSTTDSVSSEQSNMGVDCAGIVLNFLFCRFYDMILMLPDSCERIVHHCCPSYKQVITTVESTPNSNDDSCMDLDCGLFSSCQDASDCLELAMEMSELCYH